MDGIVGPLATEDRAWSVITEGEDRRQGDQKQGASQAALKSF